jgi:heme-degrading monooxygenase HmoA
LASPPTGGKLLDRGIALRRLDARDLGEGVVIVRVLTIRVRAGRVGQFNAAMRRQLPIMRQQPGLEYLKLARRLEADGGEEVVLFEEWRDPDSVYAWAGRDLSRPKLLQAAEDAADEVRVTHYEALDVGVDEEAPGSAEFGHGGKAGGGGAAGGGAPGTGGGQPQVA